jgi:hypothetical protein
MSNILHSRGDMSVRKGEEKDYLEWGSHAIDELNANEEKNKHECRYKFIPEAQWWTQQSIIIFFSAMINNISCSLCHIGAIRRIYTVAKKYLSNYACKSLSSSLIFIRIKKALGVGEANTNTWIVSPIKHIAMIRSGTLSLQLITSDLHSLDEFLENSMIIALKEVIPKAYIYMQDIDGNGPENSSQDATFGIFSRPKAKSLEKHHKFICLWLFDRMDILKMAHTLTEIKLSS